MNDGLLTAEELQDITGKKRPHCQHAWFKREFNVDLPRNAARVLISRSVWEQLQARRAGIITVAPTPLERPKLRAIGG
jgi:hypothetical protein